MRKLAILAIAAAASIAPVWTDANAQLSPSQPASPQASPPLSQGTGPGRGVPQAPVGHRQPRVGDVPNEGTITRSEADVELDRKLNICRGC